MDQKEVYILPFVLSTDTLEIKKLRNYTDAEIDKMLQTDDQKIENQENDSIQQYHLNLKKQQLQNYYTFRGHKMNKRKLDLPENYIVETECGKANELYILEEEGDSNVIQIQKLNQLFQIMQ